MTIDLTEQERAVALTLMQAGVRSFQGDVFNEACASYLHLRRKLTSGDAPAVNGAISAEMQSAGS